MKRKRKKSDIALEKVDEKQREDKIRKRKEKERRRGGERCPGINGEGKEEKEGEKSWKRWRRDKGREG